MIALFMIIRNFSNGKKFDYITVASVLGIFSSTKIMMMKSIVTW